MYLSSDRLKLAVERLGKSCATQRLVDFLILKRAMSVAETTSVPLSKNDPHLIRAICDLMEVRPGAHDDSQEEFPFINVFGTESHASKGYRSKKYVSNGTAVTVPGWDELIKTTGQNPRTASFRPSYIKHLPPLMLKAHGDMPLIADAAVWFFRNTDMFFSTEEADVIGFLIRRFIVDLQLSSEELDALFVNQQETFEELLCESAADPADYLPYQSTDLLVDVNGREDEEDLPRTDEDGIEIETKIGDERLIERPYDPSRTNILTRQITIDLLLKRIKEGEIDLNTAFQRRGDLWTETQKSRLIESLMIRIPLPSFYFDATDDSRWLVVDGLQRLTTLDLFLRKGMCLQHLEFLSEFNGKQFSDLPRLLRRRIEETQFTVNLIQPGTPANVKFYIFRRINTGGLVLNAQEIRHALNQGPAVEFLRRLAKSREFLEATDGSVSDKRMSDCELVLRFMAFTITHYNQYTQPDLDSFLNEQMARLNKQTGEFDRLSARFRRAMVTARRIFDRDAFRKHEPNASKRTPINKALFEAWGVSLGSLSENDCDKLVSRRDALIAAEKSLYLTDYGFLKSVTQGTGDVGKVRKRFQETERLIQSALTN